MKETTTEWRVVFTWSDGVRKYFHYDTKAEALNNMKRCRERYTGNLKLTDAVLESREVGEWREDK